MINNEDFNKIRKELDDFEKKREKSISDSRDIIKLSKLIIYAIHREDLKKAETLMPKLKKKALSLDMNSYDTDINKVAIQEYVEAACFYHFVKFGKLKTRKSLKVDANSYLCGLADLTGEAGRLAVNSVIRKKEGLENTAVFLLIGTVLTFLFSKMLQL